MNWELDGKVAVVTGAGSGIGRATAAALAGSGATVVIAEREAEAGATAAAALDDGTGRVSARALDVADEAAVGALFAELRVAHGGLDILVNNAGIGGLAGSVHETTLENWSQVVTVNATGQFLVAKHALPLMLERGAGAIVNLSSAFGAIGVRDYPAYCASKGAVIALTQQMAVDYGPRGIRVNAVLPGYIANDMGRSLALLDPAVAAAAWQRRERAAGLQPSGRQGTVDEVAAAIVFLVSAAASFVTGVLLPVDGGMLATLNDGGPA